MKASADVNKEDSTEAMALLKENMAATREAMKTQSAERVARGNAKANGQNKKTT